MTLVFEYSKDTNVNWYPDRKTNELFLKGVNDHARAVCQARGYVFLNDILDMLDIPRVPNGQLEGWFRSDPITMLWMEMPNGTIYISFQPAGVIYDKI